MYEIVPFKAVHGIDISDHIPPDPAIELAVESYGQAEWDEVERSSEEAYTVMKDDVPLACVGIVQRHYGCWLAWMIRNKSLRGVDMLPVHRCAIRSLNNLQMRNHDGRRIEMTVLQDFPEAVRWAEMLGFEREGLLRCYDHVGRSYYMYARIRNN